MKIRGRVVPSRLRTTALASLPADWAAGSSGTAAPPPDSWATSNERARGVAASLDAWESTFTANAVVERFDPAQLDWRETSHQPQAAALCRAPCPAFPLRLDHDPLFPGR